MNSLQPTQIKLVHSSKQLLFAIFKYCFLKPIISNHKFFTMAEQQYDAIVVGSGISGGWAAKELTEKGLKVLMLERGRNIEHIKDYVNADKEAWDFPHRGGRTQQMIEDYPVLKRDYPLNETNLDYWCSDKDHPYTETKRFDWFRGYHVGGRSLMWGRQSYRWSDMDFEANAKDGIAVDWPVRYKDIAPWYDYVEKFAGISGNRDGIDLLPDGQFLPPMDLTCVEKDVAARIKEIYKGSRHLIIGRTANITVPHEGRPGCQFRNKCWLGCPFGGYFSTQSSTLPAAMATGNLTLRPWSIVTEIKYDKDKKRATGVTVLDAETNKTIEYKAKIIFVNASTLNSTWLLMNSATDVWEGGLGSSSDALGKNLMDHHLGNRAGGIIEGYEDKYTFGRRANGFYIPRFRNLGDEKRDYIRGFGYQGSANRAGWGHDVAEVSIGGKFKDALTEPGGWSIGMMGFGEMLPDPTNKVTLDKTKKDKWGLNVLNIDCELKDNEIKMRKDILEDAKEMLERAGAKNVQGFEGDGTPGRGIHEMGTARMGRDPKTSVLNGNNQVWDAPNVFVTDGSFMTSANCVNPSLTYMAFTARAADFAVSELKKGNL
jgi:choline dehydrogenase-like flavoprotein